MDQSKSNSPSSENPRRAPGSDIPAPRRTLNLEFWVGLFTLLGVGAAGYLAVGLANLEFGPSGKYDLYAEFDNVSGLKYGASVEIGGVPIGEVAEIALKDPQARVKLRIVNSVTLRDDDILSIRTKGIIGDRYIKVSRGVGEAVPPGGTVTETESVVDIEDVISKVVHSLESKSDEDKGSSSSSSSSSATPG